MNYINDSHQGLNSLIRGIKLLVEPGLRRYVAIPLSISCLLFTLLLLTAIHYFSNMTHWVNSHIPSWLTWLDWLLWPLFILTFFIVLIYGFTFVANLVAAPFNSLLAEQVIKRHYPNHPISSGNWLEFAKSIPLGLKRQLHLLIYYLPRALGLLILFFIPFVQVIAPITWFLFNSWMMSLQYCDYAAENDHKSFKELLQWQRQNRLRCGTLGAGNLVISLIPILNFLIMPAAVIAGTLLWVENQSSKDDLPSKFTSVKTNESNQNP